MPGLGAQPATEGVSRGPDCRADARRDTSTCGGKHLVQFPQMSRRGRGDPSAGGIVIDSARQLA